MNECNKEYKNTVPSTGIQKEHEQDREKNIVLIATTITAFRHLQGREREMKSKYETRIQQRIQ